MHTPMLARLADALPQGSTWLYEPKLDGFRGLLHRDGDLVTLTSRNGRRLTDRFPEVVDASRATHPCRCTLDGEIVCPDGEGISFAPLLARMAGSGRAPAAFIAFDILSLDGTDLCPLPLRERRAILERTLAAHPSLAVIPQTADLKAAAVWAEGCEIPGVEGAVAKRADEPYRPGVRGWVKVKRRRTVDVVVGGHRYGRLLLGLYGRDGRLHHVGETHRLTPTQQRMLGRLVATERGTTFTGRPPGIGRWEQDRYDDWQESEPTIVVEVSFTLLDGMRFRHQVRLVRVREDKDAASCTLEELGDLSR